MRDVEAVDVLEIHFLAFDDHLGEFKTILFDHPQQPFFVLVLLVHYYALLQLKQRGNAGPMSFDEFIQQIVSSITLILDVDPSHHLTHLQHGFDINLLRYYLIRKETQQLFLANFHEFWAAVVF